MSIALAYNTNYINNSRDNNLTDFGKAVLSDRYLLEGETFQELFNRVATYYSDNEAHAQRLYYYISNLWFMPATPILSNGGNNRGMPVSCFLNEVSDSLEGIVDTWNENVWLASRGGGIGSYWGNLRSIGEKVSRNGRTSGIIPFIKVQDSLTLAISQGSLRRGSAAVYLPINHPEIEEFIDLRKPTGGDVNRRSLNIHHGILITDDFMKAVETDSQWNLISPKTNEIIKIVNARELWIKLLTVRIETGEPYIIFIDTVNKLSSEVYQKNNLKIKTSNLCSEITLATGTDQFDKERTAICCLSSLNLEYFEQWKDNLLFIEDIMRFLDNVIDDFIKKAPSPMDRAKYSAMRERSVGLGVMGFHSFLQEKNIPMESVLSKVWNKKIFKYIQQEVNKASIKLAQEKGACPDAIEVGLMERFANKTAIAPTASISIIAGNASPGIEPYIANAFTHKTLSGSFVVKNKYLAALLESKGMNNDQVWSSITQSEGSVQHLSFLSEHEKDVFKTATEIDQRWIVELAADRTVYIDQAQSLNIFLPPNVHKKTLHEIHFNGWKKGIKSFYYLRSSSLQRADKVSTKAEFWKLEDSKSEDQYSECLACQ